MFEERKMDESGFEVTHKVKRNFLYLLLFCTLCLSPLVAQKGTVDLGFGVGTVHDKATGTGIDANSLLGCTVATDPACVNTGHLAGVMMGFSGNYMLTKRFGAGAEVSFQPAKQDYAVLSTTANNAGVGETIQSRLTFYDFNGTARVASSKRAAVDVTGGFGGANLKFYDNINVASALGNSSQAQALTSANHFQLHAAVGIPFYVKDRFFIRPQFDIHYVPSFDQYGSNLVPQATIWVGYSFGGESSKY
jgi:hypothetical protein